MAGALMAAAVRNGQKVVCVTATKGEAGSQDPEKWPPHTIGDTRAKELLAALDILGISDHRWLGYHDGECERVDPAQAEAAIAAIITEVNPDTILTFGPEGLTGHPDHQTVSSWVGQAAAQANSKASIYHAKVDQEIYEKYLKAADAKINIFYNIDRPPLCDGETCVICFTGSTAECALKRRALGAMPSQTAVLITAFDADFLDKAFGQEVFAKVEPAP
jgi:LmbE family N-acetylglucosaminyl deacetylase